MEESIKKDPIKVFKCGHVKAAVWSNQRIIDDALVEFHPVRINRSYKDKDSDEWKHTNSFGAEYLPKVVMVANEAYKFIRLRSSEQNTDEIEPGRE